MANTFQSEFQRNIGTTPVAVYTATSPVLTSTLIGMTVANTTNDQVFVDVYVTRSTADYYLVKGASVVVGGALVPIGGDQKLVLETGDKISVKSNVATSLDVTVSLLEKTP